MTATQSPGAPPSVVRRLAMGVSVYLVARVVAGAVRLLTVPFILHAVSPRVFGTLTTLWIPVLVMHGLCNLGLGTAALRLAPECRSTSERRSLFGTLLCARGAIALVVTTLVVVLHEPLAFWLTGVAGNGRALLWLTLVRPLPMLSEAYSDELRSRGAMGKVSALVIVEAVVVHGLSLALVLGLDLELEGLVWARAAGETATFAVGSWMCWRSMLGRPSRVHLGSLFAFGWPLGVLYLLMSLRGLDRPLLRVLTSVEHVAAYELGMRLVGPVGLFNIALIMVLEPAIYAHSESRSAPASIDLFARAYVVLFATISMALALLGPEIVSIFAPDAYRDAGRALPALAFGATCEGLRRIAGIGADLAKRTRVWAEAIVVMLVVGFALVWVLVPPAGVAGAAFGWVVANVLSTFVVYRVAREVSGIALPIARGTAIVTLGAVLGTAAAWQPWPAPLRVLLLLGFVVLAQFTMRAQWKEVRAFL